MFRLVALDLKLRFIFACVMYVSFVFDIPRMDFHDLTADTARFGVPSYAIADVEVFFQFGASTFYRGFREPSAGSRQMAQNSMVSRRDESSIPCSECLTPPSR